MADTDPTKIPEMVERIARKIDPDIWADFDRIAKDVGVATASHDRRLSIKKARQILEEMRKPTGNMIDMAARTWIRENGGMEMAPNIMWRAMIDAALKE
jgi:hypothetical protein